MSSDYATSHHGGASHGGGQNAADLNGLLTSLGASELADADGENQQHYDLENGEISDLS